MKAFKFSLVLRTREKNNVSITLEETIYSIYHKRVNILNLFYNIQRFCLCLCWGFTAQSTQWDHVERGQFT